MQRKRGLELGRPFGSPLLVHRSLLGAAALVVVHLALTTFGADGLVVALGAGAGVAIAIFASLLVHEAAHELARRATGRGTTIDTTLFLFGGISRTSTEPRRAADETAVAIAGPIASVAMAVAAFVADSFVTGRLSDAIWTLGAANLVVAALNLLPALPLDGGRILASFLWSRTSDRSHAIRVAARAGEVLGVAMIMAGAWLVVTSLSTPSDAALGMWLLIVGGSVATEAARARRAVRVASLVADATAGGWARPFAGRIRSDTPVPRGGGPYAVSDGQRLAGILMPGSLWSSRGMSAGAAMIPWSPDIALRSDAPAGAALERLAASPSGVLVVLDEGGIVRGVLDAEGVQARLEGV
jgi:Zn-dependent protease